MSTLPGDSQRPSGPDALLARLQRVARATAAEPRLRVEAGPPGCGFYHEPDHHRIVCDAADLETLEPGLLLAMVAGHEAGHAAITRYHDLLGPHPPAGARMLLNALEDVRIEHWIGLRYPGLDGLLDQLHELFFARHADLLAGLPLVLQFALAAIREGHAGALPAGLAPEVLDALDRTRAARSAYAATRPPAELHALPADLAARYTATGVRERFGERPRGALPQPSEMAIRLAALEAFQIAWELVLPVYAELAAADASRGIAVAALEARVQAQRPHRFKVVWGERAGRSGFAVPVVQPFRPRRAGDDHDDGLLSLVWPLDGAVIYDRAREHVEPLIDDLLAAFLPLYSDEVRTRWATGFASGERLDLRRAQQAAAEPGLRTTVFQRRLPHRRQPRPDPIVLLADLSGSMAEQELSDALLGGCVLLCEVFGRLGLPFALVGFHTEQLEVLGFGQPLDRAAQTAIGELYLEVYGCRPGHEHGGMLTFTGPILQQVAAGLHPPAQIWVLSDGMPTGPEPHDAGPQAETLLRQAIANARQAGIQCVGLGLGPGTAPMTHFFEPYAVADIPLAQLPAALGRLTRRLLEPGGRS